MKTINVIERIAARKYYGKHAMGSVILLNGKPVFHGTVKDTNLVLKTFKARFPQK